MSYKKDSKIKSNFSSVTISLASPEMILPDTICLAMAPVESDDDGT